MVVGKKKKQGQDCRLYTMLIKFWIKYRIIL